MKNITTIVSHILALFCFSYIYMQIGASFTGLVPLVISYAICLLISPFLALVGIRKVAKICIYVLGVIWMCGGIFALKTLFGITTATISITVITVFFSIILVVTSLPERTKEINHLEIRGLTYTHAKKEILLPQSFAFFFKYSGVISAFILFYYHLISAPSNAKEIIGSAFLVILFSLAGYILYLFLGAPASAKMAPKKNKASTFFIFFSVIIIAILTAYVYTGALYSGNDYEILSSLSLLKALLTPAYIGTGFALLGILFGIFLSMLGTSLFKTILSIFKIIPSVFLALGLYSIFQSAIPLPFIASISVPMFFMGALAALTRKEKMQIYEGLPLLDRKRTISKPLLHLPNIATVPLLMLKSISCALFLSLTTSDMIYKLPTLSQIIASAVLALISAGLIVICILTQEVRHNG